MNNNKKFNMIITYKTNFLKSIIRNNNKYPTTNLLNNKK